MIVSSLRAALVAAALFFLPGGLLLRACGLRALPRWQAAVLAFPLSLALVVVATAVAVTTGAAVFTVAAVLLGASALFAVKGGSPRRPTSDAATSQPDAALPHSAMLALLALGAALTIAALVLTRTGSVDRWWYLGYVRAWMDGPIAAEEPFLGSGHVHPRFAFNAWLVALSVWAKLSAVDPLWLFDRAAPALLMPLAIGAQAMLGAVLFGTRRGAFVTACCAGLLWLGGGPVAALTRMPEDKVLATLVLTPAFWSAGLRACEGPPGAWLIAAAATALALSAVHPLAFVFACVPLAVFALTGLRDRTPARRSCAALLAIVLATAVHPLASGWIARGELRAGNAQEMDSDHPVARVHRTRERLVELGRAGFVVDPRVVSHPVALLALAGVALLARRSSRERRFLLAGGLGPLAVAFVPPLAALAGEAILPWMVHRVLWAIPFGALAAVTVDEMGRVLGRRSALVLPALVLACLPWMRGVVARDRDARESLVVPDDAVLEDAFDALRTLPASSLVAAAPELSERLPALTGVRVLAMSDRATIVFTGERDEAEARLRARAAVFAGLWDRHGSAPEPTHVLAAPRSAALRYCGDEVLRNDAFVLCTFAPTDSPVRMRLPEIATDADGANRIDVAAPAAKPAGSATARCTAGAQLATSGVAAVVRRKTGNWSPEFPSLACTVLAGAGRLQPRTLVITPLLGEAVEEFTLLATGFDGDEMRWRAHARRRAHDGDILRFGLPSGEVNRIEIEITPAFLPFVKLRSLVVTVADAPREPS